LVGAVCLLAMSFSLELISALINFGALIAFTFVNLTVIAHYAFRTRQVVDLRTTFHYVIMPAIGAILTGVLWVSLHTTALVGGIIYLAVTPRVFRRSVRSFEDPEADAQMSEPEVPEAGAEAPEAGVEAVEASGPESPEPGSSVRD